MQSLFRLIVLVLLATAACDRIPGDPLEHPEAAALLERMRAAARGDAPLPTLSELYEVAAFAGGEEQRILLARADALNAAAEQALGADDPERAELAVTAARDAQIRVIISVLGPAAVASLITHGQERSRILASGITAAGDDALRLLRMNAAAADMLERARTEFLAGENAAALDLAAHAVDLLNHVERTLAGI